MRCSKYIIEMKHNPFSGQPNISFQKEEVVPFGCCFSPLTTEPHQSENPKPERYRFYSQPKESANKKIHLITPKRVSSCSKDTQISTPRTCSREKILPQAKLSGRQKDQQKLSLTLGSKIASIRTSRETSKVSFNKDVKVEYPTGECKQSWMTTKNTTKPLPTLRTETNHLPNVDNQTSFAFLSQISLVEEEFISQGSETLQALNFIAQLRGGESKGSREHISATRVKTQRGNRLHGLQESINPFVKKMDGSGRITANSKKRLML